MNISNKLELDLDLKMLISKFCRESFNIIKKENKRLMCLIIMIKLDKIFLGTNINGKFIPKFFDPSEINQNEALVKLIEEYKENIFQCKGKIDDALPNNKLKSFNIFYHSGTRNINICLNRIGNLGIDKCRIFNEFSDQFIFD